MRALLYLFLFLLVSCTSGVKKGNDNTNKTVSKSNIKSGGDLADDRDSIVIDAESNYKITKKELREIVKNHPELKEQIQPDISYHADIEQSAVTHHNMDFSSEVGQDDYYLLYAYFLKAGTGRDKYQIQRKTLIDIYNNINHIFQQFARGGTYFGHQYSRIPGYAEYSIYEGKDNDYYMKQYDISNQKKLYINSLKQLITDELSTDFDMNQKDKPRLKAELFKTVNNIDRSITNAFYLKMAQRFQYSNY